MLDPLPNHQRTAQRDSLLLVADFRTPGGKAIGRARIRNLSATGMMAETAAVLRAGENILFELRGIGTVEAHVIWTRPGRVGLGFAERIDPQAARRPVTPTPHKPVHVPSPFGIRQGLRRP